MNSSDEIKRLEELIVKYSNLYYSGKSTISDEKFDKLVDELKKLDPENVLLKTVGWGYNVSNNRKIPHPIVNVGGLGKIKCNSSDKINFKSATPKYDGASVELIYSNGILVSAITRGNGQYGQNVKDHLIPVVGTKLDLSKLDIEFNTLFSNSTVSISGEFILSKESFKKNYPNEITYRNIPSGFLNRKEVTFEECLKFSFIPYRINALITRIKDESFYDLFTTRKNIQDTLNKLFNVSVPYIVDKDQLDKSKTYEEIIKEFSEKSDYNFDGIVVNNSDYIKAGIVKLSGDNNQVIYSYDEVAYKINTEIEEVTVTGISWNLTRTGRYIPVVEFDPIPLSGAIVRRATGHNAKNIFDKGIDKGAVINIVRSGEIIPYILDVISPVNCNKNYKCPSCGCDLIMDGVDLICPNENCESKNYQKVYQWLSYLGFVDGAGFALYDTIIKYGDIRKVSDFYTKSIDWSGIVNEEGVGQSKLDLVNKIINKLHSPMELSWILVGSNLKGISTSNADKLQNDTNLKECLDNNTPDKFTTDNAKGLGWSVWNTIIKNWDTILENYKLVKIINKSNETNEISNNKKLKISVTGSLKYGTRSKLFKDFSDKIEEVDIKNAEFLVTNNPNSGSSKNKRALDLGVKIITEEELFKNL